MARNSRPFASYIFLSVSESDEAGTRVISVLACATNLYRFSQCHLGLLAVGFKSAAKLDIGGSAWIAKSVRHK